MKLKELRFRLALWPDVREALSALYRTFRGDPERARIVLGVVCEHAWRLELDHHNRERERADKAAQARAEARRAAEKDPGDG